MRDYRCAACDVEGYGSTCWCCGRADRLMPRYPNPWVARVNAAIGRF